jgi:hypothetical protein
MKQNESKDSKIIDLAKNYRTIEKSLILEEERSLENSFIYLLQSREFEQLDAKDRAALMTKKVMAIRSDYITMQ